MTMAITLEKIHARCIDKGECWIWQGALIGNRPYLCVHEGGVRFNRRVQKQVLEMLGETVPEQTRITQSCGNPLCCAPLHQEIQASRTKAGLLALMNQNPWAPLLRRLG